MTRNSERDMRSKDRKNYLYEIWYCDFKVPKFHESLNSDSQSAAKLINLSYSFIVCCESNK